jgi:hypothetical protein
MKKEVKNLPASVHDRLKQLAKDGRRPFQDLFYYYAIERFLYRLSRSPYIEKLILKGALLFVGWRIFPRRPTRDIDVQGSIGNSVEGIVEIVKVICTTPCEPDGMRFDPDSIKGEEIMTDSNYHGVRVQFTGYLGISPVHLHLDVSFTNVITPKETLLSYPCMLGMPDFKIYAYPYETSIAEKFQAMVSLGNINDRMKDFYDIWLLTEKLDMRADTLVRAIQATFQERNTP